MKKHCIIELGTNSIKCLIANFANSDWCVLSDKIYPARLGDNLGIMNQIDNASKNRNLAIIGNLIHDIKHLDYCSIEIIATEGLRRAENALSMLKEIEDRHQIKVKILTGKQEAELSFIAVTHNVESNSNQLAVLDIGGGSTELIIGSNNIIEYSISIPIGAVVLTNSHIHTDPILPSELSSLRDNILSYVKKIEIMAKPHKLICVGGTVTTLAMLLKHTDSNADSDNSMKLAEIDGCILTKEHINLFKNTFIDQTIQERQCIPNMPKDRADIILAGTIILDQIMQHLEIEQASVSIKGIRHGYLYSQILQEY